VDRILHRLDRNSEAGGRTAPEVTGIGQFAVDVELELVGRELPIRTGDEPS
jgi:hypothetical protein